MSQSIDGIVGARPGNAAAEGNTLQVLSDTPVTLRKSCDLCVRLKRACDGKNPCHLCMRRRETCTRSVKRKSGPAKGTKYTTRRQRLEAGIPDPPSSRSKASKARSKASGGGGVNAAVGASGPAIGVGYGGGGGGRGRGGNGGEFLKMGPSLKDGSNPAKKYVLTPPIGQDASRSAVMIDAVTGGGGGRGPPSVGRRRLEDAESGRKDQTRGHHRAPPRSPAFLADDAGLPPGRGRNVTVSYGADVVPRRSISPLCLPGLPWPSPTLPPATTGGGALDGAGGDYNRGSCASPFGLLSGPPSAMAGRPLRGGTREPHVDVEVGGGPGHFRAPRGAPTSKRYRMSPPFSPRDGLPGQRTVDDCSLEMLIPAKVGPPEDESFRGTGRETRDHGGGSAPFHGGGPQLLSPSSYSAPSNVGSFDSSNALGAILDGRHGRGHRNGMRHRDTRGVEAAHREHPSDTGDASTLSLPHERQQDWDPSGMRFLPHPGSGSGAGGTRVMSADTDHTAARWRQGDDTGSERTKVQAGRWRGGGAGAGAGASGGQQQPFHHDQQHRGDAGGFTGSAGGSGGGGDGGGGGSGGSGSGATGVVIDSTRDLLAEAAAAGSNEGGWGVSNGGGRTVLITHGDDDDTTIGNQPRSWGVPDVGGPSLSDTNRHSLVSVGGAGDRGGAGAGGSGRNNHSGERGDWAFNANASSVPAVGRAGGVVGGPGVDGIGSVVGAGSENGGSEVGAVGLRPTADPAGRSGRGAGSGVWPENPLVLPSPPASPAAKAALQKTRQQRAHHSQPQHIAMPLPPASGGGGGRESPFLGTASGGAYRGGAPSSMEVFRGGGRSSSPLWTGAPAALGPGPGPAGGGPQQSASPPESYFRNASLADPRPVNAAGAWDGAGGGHGGGGEGGPTLLATGGTPARGREPPVRTSAPGSGSGVWQTSWGGAALPGQQRAGFDRERGWLSEYSI